MGCLRRDDLFKHRTQFSLGSAVAAHGQYGHFGVYQARLKKASDVGSQLELRRAEEERRSTNGANGRESDRIYRYPLPP